MITKKELQKYAKENNGELAFDGVTKKGIIIHKSGYPARNIQDQKYQAKNMTNKLAAMKRGDSGEQMVGKGEEEDRDRAKKVIYKERIIDMINSVNKLKVTNKYKLTNEFLEMLKKVEEMEKINIEEVEELLKITLDKIKISSEEIREFTLYTKGLFDSFVYSFVLKNE